MTCLRRYTLLMGDVLAENLTHRRYDTLHVAILKFGRQGETYCLPADLHCIGPVLRHPTEPLLVIWMFGDRQVMHACSDAFVIHGVKERVTPQSTPGLVHQCCIQVVGMASVGFWGRG